MDSARPSVVTSAVRPGRSVATTAAARAPTERLPAVTSVAPKARAAKIARALPLCDLAYPVRCGSECCAEGIACVDSHCTCPSDHPLECSVFCCLATGSCTSNFDCACPSDQVPCTNDGETCCPEPAQPTCGLGELLFGCPDGTTRCCSENMVCCHDSMNGGAVGCEFVGFCE